ncbi:UNVERIFIED_CONTAM: hypothetical protein Sradi_3117100 [Sesamum radiatum]|uniref:Uncharacterized protein n=1 Tax=Sesamum radiatum TaxID=300843 RepID=A0AAW2RES7_SESRA
MDHVVKVGQSPALMAGSTPAVDGAHHFHHIWPHNNDFSPNHMPMQTPSPLVGMGPRASSPSRSLQPPRADFLKRICWDRAGSGWYIKVFCLAEKRWRLRASRPVAGRRARVPGGGRNHQPCASSAPCIPRRLLHCRPAENACL